MAMIPKQNYHFTLFLENIGKTVEPVAELIKFLWMIISPGQEDYSKAYMIQSITHEYGQLYRLDVLGLADTSDGDQNIVYAEFKDIFSGVHKDDTRLGCHGNQIMETKSS